jgi:hypothetical protein
MRDVHFIVLIHGMWGSPDHLQSAARIILETFQKLDPTDALDIDVLVATTNRGESTYDGIDYGGHRVHSEVRLLCTSFI